MIKRVAFLALSVGLLVTISACNGFKIPDKYIRLPLDSRGLAKVPTAQEKYLDDYKKLLSNLELGPISEGESMVARLLHLNSIPIPDAILKRLTWLKNSVNLKWTSWEHWILHLLTGLASNELDCSKHNIEAFLTAYQLLSEGHATAKSKVLLKYLLHYGARKFGLCSEQLMRKFKENDMDKATTDKEITNYFRQAFKWPAVSTDQELYNKLKDVDITKAKLNVRKLARISSSPKLFAPASKRILWTFNENCSILEDVFGFELTILNLAGILNTEADPFNIHKYFYGDFRLLKLNEIKRICLDAQRIEDGLLFKENLQNQLKFFVL